MLTKDQIISALYTGKNFNDCLAKMEPEHLREDLRQEVILIVCEWPEEKIQKLHGEGALEFYVVRVILNQCQSNTSPFYKKYRQVTEQWADSFLQTFAEKGTWLDDNGYSTKYTRQISAQVAIEDQQQEFDERVIREQLADAAIEEINNLYWYDKELILLYLKVGSFRAIEEQTKIPFISCYKNIKKSLAILKRKASENMPAAKPLFTKQELSTI